MAIKKVEMFTVVCDNCKLDIGTDAEYSCWNDELYTETVAMESDWIKEEHNHYCPDCYEYDDDDNLIIKIERKDINLRTAIN